MTHSRNRPHHTICLLCDFKDRHPIHHRGYKGEPSHTYRPPEDEPDTPAYAVTRPWSPVPTDEAEAAVAVAETDQHQEG